MDLPSREKHDSQGARPDSASHTGSISGEPEHAASGDPRALGPRLSGCAGIGTWSQFPGSAPLPPKVPSSSPFPELREHPSGHTGKRETHGPCPVLGGSL